MKLSVINEALVIAFSLDMKEIQIVLIKNQLCNQFTTYNYPLLTRISEFHQE